MNDAPSFVIGADQSVLQNAGARVIPGWATALSAGPADEAAQALDFLVTTNNPGLFSAAPAIAPDGTLTFTPSLEASGSATVTVRLHDNGGSANGGNDTSAPQTFLVTSTAVNDPPSFLKGTDQVVLQTAGPVLIAGWASAISRGPSDETLQALDFFVTNDNPALFSVAPTVTPDGALSFTPSPITSGSANVTVTLHDSGGTETGGQDTSAPQTFVITTRAVNSAPTFNKGPDVSAAQDAGPQMLVNWATSISAGPSDESAQAVSFTVVSDKPGLFAVQPAVSADGTLTFSPAPHGSGTAQVTVTLHDDGGAGGGSVDTSAPQTFSIDITTLSEETGTYNGLAQPACGVLEDARAGLIKVTITPRGRFTGRLTLQGKALPFSGSFDNAGIAHFGKSVVPSVTLKRRGQPGLVLSLSLDVSGHSGKLTGALTVGGQMFAIIDAERALFTAKKQPAAPFQNVPPSLLGKYTVIFTAKTPAEQGRPGRGVSAGRGRRHAHCHSGRHRQAARHACGWHSHHLRQRPLSRPLVAPLRLLAPTGRLQ